MNAEEVLIRIRTEFQDQATAMARQAFSKLKASARSLGEDLQLGLMGAGGPTSMLGRLGQGISGVTGALRGLRSGGAGGFFQSFASGINSTSSALQGFIGRVRNTAKTLTMFNTIFGRVTVAMLIWSGWRKVAEGFRAIADSIVGANMRMQSAEQMFTALSGGSEEIGGRYIEILKSLSIETGASLDQLVSNAKRLPTQVGQNFEAFTELTRKAIVLGFLDPVQDVEGAMFALSNFMEGTAAGARSLVQRFELFNTQMVKRAFEQAADPVEALDILFKEAGIDVDLMIDKLQNTLPVALNGLNAMFREFFRVLGEPVMDNITKEVIRLRDWVQDNQPQLQGLGQSLGAGIERGFQRAKDFLSDMLGLDAFNAEDWFDAGVELMVNLTDGMFSAITGFVLPAITQIASIIGSFFIGASPPPMGPLKEIMEGGRNTIEAYVEGLVAGLDSATIAGMAADILDNIINLEAQELAQEKAIKELEKWVEEASDAVEAKRRQIKLFDLQTEDIPERFTRGRKRQLELELLAAQDEEKRRKKALDIAKEQLKVTQDYLRAQEQILRTLERQQKEKEKEEGDEAKSELDKSFKDVTGFDSEAMKAEIEKWKAIFDQKLQPLFDAWKAGLGDLADFVRGFLGAEPSENRGITEMFSQGALAREGIDNIIHGLTELGKAVKDILDGANERWGTMDPLLKKLILAAVGILVFPKIALVAGITLLLDDPTNVKGFILALGGLFGAGGGPLLLGGIGALTKTFGIVFNLTFMGAVGLLHGLLTALGISFAGIGAGASIGASALVLPVSIVVGAILWKGKDLFLTIARFEMVVVIKAIEGLANLQNMLQNIFPKWMWLQQTPDLDVVTGELAKGFLDQEAEIEGWKQPWEKLWYETLPGVIEGAKNAIEKGSDETLYGIPVSQAERGYDALVGRSIIPDMMDRIVELWRDLPTRIKPHLDTLYSTIMRMMTQISYEWQMEWYEMMINTSNAMEYMTDQFLELEQMLQELSYMNQQLEYQQAQQAVSGTQQAGEIAAANQNVQLNLDAAETRKLMEEGTWSGIAEAFSPTHNQRGIR